MERHISFLLLPIVVIFSSCNSCKYDENKHNSPESLTEKEIVTNDLTIQKSDNNESRIDLQYMKSELDTFVISVKKTNLPFELKTDTIGDHSSYKDLWDFEKGIFELINPDSTQLLVRHHFLIPKSKEILRLFLLEIKFSNSTESNSFFHKLIDRKDYKADLGDGYYIEYGLTGTTDYVVKIENEVLWFNVSCQYSKKEFNQLIEIFNNNVDLTDRVEIIKCFCQEACE